MPKRLLKFVFIFYNTAFVFLTQTISGLIVIFPFIHIFMQPIIKLAVIVGIILDFYQIVIIA